MVVVVIGPTGSGKSTFVGTTLRGIKNKHIVIIDDSDFYAKFFTKIKKVPLTERGDQYQKLDIDKLIVDTATYNTPLLFEVSQLQTQNVQKFLDILGEKLLKGYKDLVLVIDEAYRLFPRYKFSTTIAQLLRSGRKRGISVYLIFQQFRDIDPQGVREATWGIGFKPQGPSEIENFQKTFDFYNVNTLGPHSYVIKNFRTGQLEINTLFKSD